MPRTSEEDVVEAVKRVLREQRKVHSLERLHQLVREELRRGDPEATVSRERLRRIILQNRVGRVEIDAREDDGGDFPGDCPVCGNPMKNVKNETLYGWEVTLQRRCTVCPYWSGKNRRVPTLYVFHRR